MAIVILTFLGLMLFMPVLGMLFGMFGGFIIQVFGLEWIVLDFLHRLGMDIAGLHTWQIGGALGFLGGYLKTNSTSSTTNN